MPDPTTARRDGTVEVLHGVEVADPYRWMEELGSEELGAWVDAVAEEADAALAALPGRDALRRSVARALDTPRCGAPWRRGTRWFQLRNSGLQDHDVLWVADEVGDQDGAAPRSGWRPLVDPNTWDGARSLGPVAASDDGSLLAYAVSEGGSDWQTWHVRDVASGDDLPDEVRWSKFTGAAWLADGSGFVTGTFPAPEAGREHEAATTDQQVVVHRLGGTTETVHALPDEPEAGFDVEVSHDGRWLLLSVSRGTDPENRLHVAPIAPDGTVGEVVRLVEERDAAWHPIGVVGDELWAVTDRDAPRRRVVAIPLDGRAHRQVLAERGDQLETARLAGAAAPGDPGWLVTSHLRDAASVVTIHDLDGVPLREVEVSRAPVSVGSEHLAGELRTSRSSPVLHLVATSFQDPAVLVRVDCRDAAADTHLAHDCSPVGVADTRGEDVVDVVVERAFVTSGEVRVPVFVLHRPGVRPTGAVPTVLWGYGGFDIAVTPHFRPAWRAWVDHGGVMAIACLRGGSEYGRAWADDGRLANKQHVFDDALAVAAWLCGEGEAFDGQDDDATRLDGAAWTSPPHLGIEGRSNGGLLAAACLTQAPDRFGSAVPEVGVLDLLRFHRFTIGWAWTSDYGDPDEEEAFHVARAYSPLHNLRDGEHYPPTLLTTADTDDRVVPSHSFKFAAALRHAQGGDAPVLLRVDRAAGHGAGKPTSQVIDERVDVLAWHAHHLGLAIDDRTR
jgi:prolyl oligopeptidase